MSQNERISPPLVPNQALYQDERQHELIVNPVRQRGVKGLLPTASWEKM
jgi:hypothetical protein